MRRVLRILLVLLAWWGAVAQTPLPPPPQRWVTDEQAHLSDRTREELDQRLAAYQNATGHQVLVWIGGSTGETQLEDWAVRTFAAWKVGRKGMDDGLVLFILAQDRKLRIEVGYGLEGQLPDALASRIIRETITPKLGTGNWDGAVSAGIEQILTTLGGEVRSDREQQPSPVQGTLGLGQIILFGLLGLGFLILLITHPGIATWLLFSLFSGGGRSGGSGWSGGSGSGGGWSGGGGSSGGGGASGSW
jgi:uncharacterized protein